MSFRIYIVSHAVKICVTRVPCVIIDFRSQYSSRLSCAFVNYRAHAHAYLPKYL